MAGLGRWWARGAGCQLIFAIALALAGCANAQIQAECKEAVPARKAQFPIARGTAVQHMRYVMDVDARYAGVFGNADDLEQLMLAKDTKLAEQVDAGTLSLTDAHIAAVQNAIDAKAAFLAREREETGDASGGR